MVTTSNLAPVVVLNIIKRKPAPRSEIGKEAIAKWNCVREFDGSPTRCVRNMCSTM
jgi:hypothetical protein